MVCRLSRRSFVVGGGASLAAPFGASGADFYQGKTLTVIVGFAPGGGVDTTARLLAKHLVRFIPGRPALVVRNMEGAAGVVAATYLERRIAPDGLTLAVPGRSWFVYGAAKIQGINLDPAKFTFIGSLGALSSMLYVRASTGIKTFADLKASRSTLTFGSIGSLTPTGMIPTMLAEQGAPIKVVFGYVSTARLLLALEQGEIDGVFTVEDTFSRRQDLLRNGVLVPILQNKQVQPGLPVLRNVLANVDERLLALAMALETFGLPLVGPPNIPADLAAILRKAFMEMTADEEFRAEAVKLDQPIGAPLSGAQLQSMIEELTASAAPEVIAEYKRLGAAR